MQGKIIKIISNRYTVISNNEEYICKSRGKFRNMNITPLVGDNVLFDENKSWITDILPRCNELVRPYVANVDQVFILSSVKEPNLDLYLLDKLLTIIEFNNIKAIICFTKIDLLDNLKEIDIYRSYYEKIGYQVFFNNEIDKIKQCFKNKITVFTGQSGAGKSTLLNMLDCNLNLETNFISKALGRGKHTTRYTALLPVLEGWVADTPGFSNIDFKGMTNTDIRDSIIEFNQYRNDCKYKDCMHNKESECRIKKEVGTNILKSRYHNYLKFISGGKAC